MGHLHFVNEMLETGRPLHLLGRVQIRAFDDENLGLLLVPDMHLLTEQTARQYRHSFGRSGGVPVNRAAALTDVLTAAKTAELAKFQLGDVIDLWRERANPDGLQQVVESVLRDNPAVPLGDFDGFVLGNHDRIGGTNITCHPGFTDAQPRVFLNGGIQLVHGDEFDELERLPDSTQVWVVRWLSHGHEGEVHALPAMRINAVSELPTRFGVSREPVDDMLAKYPKARIIAMGHTHRAQLTEHRGRIVLDCGAWVERCVLNEPGAEPSCQVGVIDVADGVADVALYQVALNILR